MFAAIMHSWRRRDGGEESKKKPIPTRINENSVFTHKIAVTDCCSLISPIILVMHLHEYNWSNLNNYSHWLQQRIIEKLSGSTSERSLYMRVAVMLLWQRLVSDTEQVGQLPYLLGAILERL